MKVMSTRNYTSDEPMSRRSLISPRTSIYISFCCELAGTRDQYCESESFHATCPTHHVIAMHSAMYGRMRIGRCVEADLGGHLGCGTSVLDLTDQRCSGRSDCNIRIPDGEFDTRKPCFKELKVYLEANYTCLRGRLFTPA